MGKRAIAIAAVALLVGVAAGYAFGSSGDDGSSGAGTDTGSPSPSPVHLVKVGGVFMNERHDELTADMEPYPYTSPIPPREPTAIDGTYVRIMSLHYVGGPVVGLPYRCLRCIPYRVDPGTTTLIFYEGRYFLHHYLSGFKALGHYTVDGDGHPPVQRPELLLDGRRLPVAAGRPGPHVRRRPATPACSTTNARTT